jgi:uncharacterized iron-regulated membrane protein
LVKDPERVVLEELHDASNPRVAARGAAGEGEVVSLDGRMDRQESQAPGQAARSKPRHERDADAGRHEPELNGEVVPWRAGRETRAAVAADEPR